MKRFVLILLLGIGLPGAIASHLWLKTTQVQLSPLDPPMTSLGIESCAATEEILFAKISPGASHIPALLTPDDINHLFTCRLYDALGEVPGTIQQTQVSIQDDQLKAEALIDLSKIPDNLTDYRAGSRGPTVISKLAQKLKSVPILSQQTIYFAMEGEPAIANRSFVFYSEPTLDIGAWQLTLSDIVTHLRIPESYLQEWLEKEYSFLPAEPLEISLTADALKIHGAPHAW